MSLSNGNELVETADDNATKYNVVNLIYYTDNIFVKKPMFDQDHKLLTLFAKRDITLKPKKFKYFNSADSILLTKYVYNFSSTSDFLLKCGIRAHAIFIMSKTEQRLVITLQNLTPHKRIVHTGTELTKIRFVTHSFIDFKINSNLDCRYFNNDSNHRNRSDRQRISGFKPQKSSVKRLIVLLQSFVNIVLRNLLLVITLQYCIHLIQSLYDLDQCWKLIWKCTSITQITSYLNVSTAVIFQTF